MLVQPIISLSNNITLGTNVGSTDNFTKPLEMSLLSVFQTHENVIILQHFSCSTVEVHLNLMNENCDRYKENRKLLPGMWMQVRNQKP